MAMKKIAEMKLGEVNEWLEKNQDSIAEYYESIEVEKTDDSVMIVDDIIIRIPSLSLDLRSGVWCEKDGESEDYLPDWSLTLIQEQDSEMGSYLYYEQDDYAISLHNYLSSKKISADVDNLSIEVWIPEE